MNINYVQIDSLKVPEWKATYILRPDLMVLSASLQQHGFIQPIHVSKWTGEIIDGSERWLLAKNVKSIAEATKGLIPVVEHDCDLIDAMMLHVQLNRGKGTIVAKPLSRIIRKINSSGKYDIKDFKNLLSMGVDELDLLLDASIIKSRKIQEHTYARAWVPIEADSKTVDRASLVESPPNPDR